MFTFVRVVLATPAAFIRDLKCSVLKVLEPVCSCDNCCKRGLRAPGRSQRIMPLSVSPAEV